MDELFEMRLPPGVTEHDLAYIIENFDVELKHTEMGPTLKGTKQDLENIRDYMVKSLNERIRHLEKGE